MLLIPSCHNPQMCGDVTSAKRLRLINSTRRDIPRRSEAKSPLSSYLGRGLESGPEAASALPLCPQPEVIWRSLILATTMIKLSRLFPPGNMHEGEGTGPGVSPRKKPGQFYHFFANISDLHITSDCGHSGSADAASGPDSRPLPRYDDRGLFAAPLLGMSRLVELIKHSYV